LPYGKASHPRINRARSKEFEGVVSINVCPHGEKDFNGLLDFTRITPGDRLQKFGQTTFVSCQIKPEFPYEIFLFQCQELTWRIIKYLLG
jgi:hypothetical protein